MLLRLLQDSVEMVSLRDLESDIMRYSLFILSLRYSLSLLSSLGGISILYSL